MYAPLTISATIKLILNGFNKEETLQKWDMADFIVDTNEYCFICLKKLEKVTSSSSSSICSLDGLSRHLKVNRRKVFNEKVPIPPHLLAKVETAELKAKLCEGCASTNDKFLKLYIGRDGYKKVEQMEEEVDPFAYNLLIIHEKMKTAERSGVTKIFYKSVRHKLGKEKSKIVEALRKDVFQKCISELSRFLPQLKIKKLTKKEVILKKQKLKDASTPIPIEFPLIKQEPPPPEVEVYYEDIPDINYEIEIGEVKVERLCANSISEEDGSGGSFEMANDYDDDNNDLEKDGDLTSEYSDSDFDLAQEKTELLPKRFYTITRPSSLPVGLKRQSNLDEKTGLHGCGICSKPFASQNFFLRHFDSVHLLVRYKCNICEKVLMDRKGCLRHLKRIHPLTQRARDGRKCHCGKRFPDASKLHMHLKLFHSEDHPASLLQEVSPRGNQLSKMGKPEGPPAKITTLEMEAATAALEQQSAPVASLRVATEAKIQKDFGSAVRCGTCGQEFPTPGMCKKHRQLVHAPRPDRKCDRPGCTYYAFHGSRDLARHKSSRTCKGNAKPRKRRVKIDEILACRPCKTTFCSRASFSRHMKNMHNNA